MSEVHRYDVVVIGAGGAGLRAAIEASRAGARTAVLSKSPLGRVQTFSSASLAAALGAVEPKDGWAAHFRDTLRGGHMLNNPRMAELLAKEAPARVQELVEWGAAFDQTGDGRINQTEGSGHTYPRLVRAADRTGIEVMRALHAWTAATSAEVFPGYGALLLLKDGARIVGVLAYRCETGERAVFAAPAVVLATGGFGRIYRVSSNLPDTTGDGHALALWAGAELIDMEFVQFHPTGLVRPAEVSGFLVGESVRNYGGVLRNGAGERFMFRYVPAAMRGDYAEDEAEADRYYGDPRSNRRPPELMPRDEVSRAIALEIAAGGAAPGGGVILDIGSRRDASFIRRHLPRMTEQLKALAGIDLTQEPVEIAPTCHYAMGGVRIDPETTASGVPGLFAAGEVAGGLHGANRLNGNGVAELFVFGMRAGAAAAAYAGAAAAPAVDHDRIAAVELELTAPAASGGHEDPEVLHRLLQECMQRHAGIGRTSGSLETAIRDVEMLNERSRHTVVREAPGQEAAWPRSIELRFELTVAEAVLRSALLRRESRGAHVRNDYPAPDPALARRNTIVRQQSYGLEVVYEPKPSMPDELRALI